MNGLSMIGAQAVKQMAEPLNLFGIDPNPRILTRAEADCRVELWEIQRKLLEMRWRRSLTRRRPALLACLDVS